MSTFKFRQFVVGVFFVVIASSFIRAFLFSNDDPVLSEIQIPIHSWVLCEGNVQAPSDSSCKDVDKARSITPRNVGTHGIVFTYFAKYDIEKELPENTYALNLGPVGDEDRVWVDDQYIGQTAFGDELAVGIQSWKMYGVDRKFVSPGTHNVRIEVDYTGPMFGGVLGNPMVTTGKFASISKYHFEFYRSYLPLAFAIALIFMSLYNGFVGLFGSKNKSFYYDYMGLGICFSLFVGCIGFAYTYMGFNWRDTVTIFCGCLLGSLYFSLRLILHSNYWKERSGIYKKRIDVFIGSMAVIFLILMAFGQHFAGIFLFEILFNSLLFGFTIFNTKHAIKNLRKEITPYHLISLMVGPAFAFSFTMDLYKQFNNAGSIFLTPYALVLLGVYVMYQLARDHAAALRDQELKNELEIKNEKLKYLSEHDPLTTLYNRRTFESLIEYNINQANENKGSALLVLDIDHFKAYNDAYGHPAGDRLLVAFSQLLKDEVRMSDQVARLGGEEFGVFLHNVTYDQAQTITENIRKAIESTEFEFRQKTGKPITASIGAIHIPAGIKGIEYSLLYKVADKGLYKAKETRNTININAYA